MTDFQEGKFEGPNQAVQAVQRGKFKMNITTVGIHSPGDMGEATARLLKTKGLRVVAALEGRSERTRGLAAQAGVEDLGTMEGVVQAADIVLAILTPSSAYKAAQKVAEALRSTQAKLLYVDCNAISPDSSRKAAAIVQGAGGRYVDAGIIGPPPRGERRPRYYASGEHAEDFASLREFGLDVRIVGPEIGQASGLVMCFSGLQKGLVALAFQSLLAARQLDLVEPLLAEIDLNQPPLREFFRRFLPIIPPKTYRFAGEMNDVAATHSGLGTAPGIQREMAKFYQWMAGTRLGKQSPEDVDKSKDFIAVIEMLAEELEN